MPADAHKYLQTPQPTSAHIPISTMLVHANYCTSGQEKGSGHPSKDRAHAVQQTGHCFQSHVTGQTVTQMLTLPQAHSKLRCLHLAAAWRPPQPVARARQPSLLETVVPALTMPAPLSHHSLVLQEQPIALGLPPRPHLGLLHMAYYCDAWSRCWRTACWLSPLQACWPAWGCCCCCRCCQPPKP